MIIVSSSIRTKRAQFRDFEQVDIDVQNGNHTTFQTFYWRPLRKILIALHVQYLHFHHDSRE